MMKHTAEKFIKISLTFVCAALCILKAQSAAAGVSQGIGLCVKTLVPSLLPFLVTACYMSKISFDGGKFTKKLCSVLFDLPPCSACVFLMSMVGGFPVGAKMTSEYVKSQRLGRAQGRRMMLFCINAGPAFVINTVGEFMLGSKKAGTILLVSLFISSFCAGVVLRFFTKDEKTVCKKNTELPQSNAFVSSVSDALKTMLSICGWVVVFCAIIEVFNSLPLNEELKLWLGILCEVTSGCSSAAKNFPIPITAFVLSWSGLAVHAQIMPFLNEVGLKYTVFASFRALCAGFTAAVCAVLLKIFPCESSVFSNVSQVTPVAFSVSAPAAAAMLITCALVILDLAPTKKM